MNPKEKTFIPSGMRAPLDQENLEHRKVLRDKMQAWLTEGNRKHDALYALIEERHREEQGDNRATLDFKTATLRAFLSRPEQQGLKGKMNLAYRALDQAGAWDPPGSNRTLLNESEHHLFYSMHGFLDVKQLTSVALLRRLPGVYRVYRPIVTHPGCFIIGYLAASADPDTGVLSYREYNRIQRRAGREEKTLELHGYAFKKSALVYFMATDKRKNSFHLTIMTGQEKNGNDQYSVLTGGFLDTIGNQAYSGRVLLERMPDVSPSDHRALGQLEEAANMFTAQELPPSVLTFFRRDANEDIVLF